MTPANPQPLDLEALADALRRLGYDIAPDDSGRPAGSAIIARRDLGERTALLTIDRSGRMRADLTWQVGEWPATITLGGTELRSVDSVRREVSLTGQASSGEQAAQIAANLGQIEPWAAPTRERSDPAAELPPPPG
ncbi:MAG: hypothetical protein QM692_15325 [Thermomicrobiales bacterium]